jgi:hypothetical protein
MQWQELEVSKEKDKEEWRTCRELKKQVVKEHDRDSVNPE